MTIVQQGVFNPAAQVVPDADVIIVPPQVQYLNGVPANTAGIVGTATWGPVNKPTLVSDVASYVANFGPVMNRLGDLGTHVAAAVAQGANNFRIVRVTDGLDAMATVTYSAATSTLASTIVAAVNSGIAGIRGASRLVTASNSGATVTFTSVYSGSGGNAIAVLVGAGSAAGSTKVSIAMAGGQPEIFDNLAGVTSTSSTVTLAGGLDGVNFSGVASIAVSAGGSGYTNGGPYALTISGGGGTGAAATAMVAGGVVTSVTVTSAGAGYTAAPTVSLTGESGSGASFTVALQSLATSQLGADAVPRSGMYALRNTGCAVGWLADCSAVAGFATQAAFGLSEGIYIVGVGAMGELMASAIANKASAGVDSYAFKLMLGDWIYWQDSYNGLLRLISPQPFVGGLIAAYGPQYSSLNQPLNAIVATQMSYSNQVYSLADLQTLGLAGIDVITNPSVGGRYFSARFGHNSSSNAAIHGDNYTRMTNFIASTINSAAGQFVGMLNTPGANGTQGHAQAFIESFFDTMLQAKPQPMIAAYSVQLDGSNNTQQSIAQGYLNAYVKVRYQSVVEFFNIYMEGGQSVVTRQQTTALV